MNKEAIKYKIRRLVRKDRKTLTKLIRVFVEKSGQQNLINMIPSSDVPKGKNVSWSKPSSMSNEIALYIKRQ